MPVFQRKMIAVTNQQPSTIRQDDLPKAADATRQIQRIKEEEQKQLEKKTG